MFILALVRDKDRKCRLCTILAQAEHSDGKMGIECEKSILNMKDTCRDGRGRFQKQ